MIIEVLSPSTEAYDRGDKFTHYRQIASLTDYILISATKAQAEHFQRRSDEDWLLTVRSGLDAILPLSENEYVEFPVTPTLISHTDVSTDSESANG